MKTKRKKIVILPSLYYIVYSIFCVLYIINYDYIILYIVLYYIYYIYIYENKNQRLQFNLSLFRFLFVHNLSAPYISLKREKSRELKIAFVQFLKLWIRRTQYPSSIYNILNNFALRFFINVS